MNTQTIGEKIVLNFGWKGPNSWQGGMSHGGLEVRVIDLLFKNAKTAISVHIPDNLNCSTVKRLSFICRKYQEIENKQTGSNIRYLTQETHPESLKVTVEQIRNLTIKAGFFEESPHKGPATMDNSGRITQEKRILRSDSEIKLESTEELEIGQTYCLVITSDNLSLSARLVKEKANATTSENEFENRLKKMGEALFREGVQNLDLASKGGANVFNSSSTSADIFAHVMKGIVKAGQEMHSDIKVPQTKPSESFSDLNLMTIEELQSRFETIFKKDKEFESLRMQAAITGNIPEMNRIMELELANSQLLIKLAEALERKGVKAQFPN